MLEITNLNFLIIFAEGILLSSEFKKKNRSLLMIVSLQLILLLGFRSNSVGIDTETYVTLFSYVEEGANITYLEIGNQVLLWLAAHLFHSYTVMLTMYATITVWPVFWVIRKESDNAFFSIIIYAGFMYYYWAFNGMRQAAAMSIALVAVHYLQCGKDKQFLIFTILSASLHKSALIILAFWLVKKLKIRVNKNWAILIIALSGIGVLAGPEIISVGLLLMKSYAEYLDSGFAGAGNLFHPILFMMIFLFLLLIKNEMSDANRLYLTMLGVGVVLYFISVRIQIVNRLTYYFTMPLIILLPNIIESLQSDNRKVLKVISYLGISLYQLLLVLRGAQGITPYRFFWQ